MSNHLNKMSLLQILKYFDVTFLASSRIFPTASAYHVGFQLIHLFYRLVVDSLLVLLVFVIQILKHCHFFLPNRVFFCIIDINGASSDF